MIQFQEKAQTEGQKGGRKGRGTNRTYFIGLFWVTKTINIIKDYATRNFFTCFSFPQLSYS